MNLKRLSLPHRLLQCVISTALLGLALLPVEGLFSNAEARELQGRLGLGYNAEFANVREFGGVPGISLKYGLTRDIAAELIVAVATGDAGDGATGVKLFKNLFYETNLNFYYMLGGAILSANDRAGAEFISGFGAEFFFPGLESLGFAFETGVSFHNLTGSFQFRTLGFSFVNAGIHFYF